ncbi:ComF family protein [Sphingobacterium kyonggiense]
MLQFLLNSWTSFWMLFYPEVCYACQKNLMGDEHGVCSFCQYHLPYTDDHLDSNNPCFQQLKGRSQIQFATALFRLSNAGLVENLIYNLKYNSKPQIGYYFGREYGAKLLKSPFFENIDLLVPIPLHPKRKRKRGYNQSAKIAMGLASILQVPVDETILFRTVQTKTQTRLSSLARVANVSGVFSCSKKPAIDGKHIVLIDDVLTTGATLVSAADAIMESYPNCKLSVICLAKAS